MPSIQSLPYMLVAKSLFIVSFHLSFCTAAEPINVNNSTFEFVYAGAIKDLNQGDKASIWLPVASETTEQQILATEIKTPETYQLERESEHGNQTLFFRATADENGEIPFEVIYRVARRGVSIEQSRDQAPASSLRYLAGSSLVPIDQNFSREVLGDEKLSPEPMTAARQIYDAINRRMKYDKPEGGGWGRGDSTWACDSRFGNCTDFHSLFISICREQQIPAKFEIGFPIPLTKAQGAVGGYHCWAKFAAQDKWNCVDISEANKEPSLADFYFGNQPPDRITFSSGRDLTLSPKQELGPINFLVYPYVEVEGRIHTSLRKDFRFRYLGDRTNQGSDNPR